MTSLTEIRRQASEWFVRIHSSDDPSPELVQEWLEWLKASEIHQRAFEDIARIWHSTTPALIAQRARTRAEPAYDASVPIIEWRRQQLRRPGAPAAGGRGRVRRIRTRSVISVSAAAVLALTTALILYRFEASSRPSSISSGTFATGTGGHLDLLLA